MKRFKKMMAIAIVAVMTMMYAVPTWAATGDHLATAENKIEATDVVAGDSVEYYQLVHWDNGNWALTDLGSQCGVTLENLVDGITEAEATTIANAMTGKTKTGDMEVNATTDTTFEKTGVAAGLYYLKAIPATNNLDTVYNPAFVSADYTEGGNTVSFGTTYESSAVVKKSSVPFDKEVDSTNITDYVDVKPGDTIPYKITTKVPSFGTTFDHPVFTIKDTLSSGLTLGDTITVKYGDQTTTTNVANVVTIEKGTPTNGFTVTFQESYLKGLNGATPEVEITYSATVQDVTDNVTYLDNKAKLTFSNSPTTTKDQDDITRHYTFSIDGNLLGSSQNQTDELIKVACDENGSPIYETKTTYYDKQVNPLDGAEFTLTPTGSTGGTAKTATSTKGGHIQFLGLDAGTYELVETAAPSGYVKDSKTYIVEIVPTYDDATSDAPILTKYEVKFYEKGASSNTLLTTTTFNTTNEGEGINKTVTTSADGDHTQVIGNTPGKELPSTGGMGTTLFYLIGAILVIGAGVILVTRKRVEQ